MRIEIEYQDDGSAKIIVRGINGEYNHNTREFVLPDYIVDDVTGILINFGSYADEYSEYFDPENEKYMPPKETPVQ